MEIALAGAIHESLYSSPRRWTYLISGVSEWLGLGVRLSMLLS